MMTGEKLEKEKLREKLVEYEDLERDTLGATGVLLSDKIKYYAINHGMIYPFEEKNLKPAAYYLTIGGEYAIGGEIKTLTDAPEDRIVIPPFELAVVRSREIINLPRFLIARWNIRVTWAYKGLLWVGAAQVDPGWVGYLSCPIYNLSNKSVRLRYGEPIATMDFVKTTNFNQDCKKYKRVPDRISFEDYEPDGLESALLSEVVDRLKKTETRVDRSENILYGSIAMVMAILAILFAILSAFVTTSQKQVHIDHVLVWLSFGLSIIATVVGCCALFASKRGRHRGNR